MANLALDFTGRTAIVSGAARGIGLEVARQLRSAGAAVYLLDYDQDEVLRAADEIGARGLAGDVSRTDDVEVAVQQAVEETGRLDIVVNNAGVLRDKVLWRLSDEDWDSVLAVHLGGTFRLTRAAAPHFRRQLRDLLHRPARQRRSGELRGGQGRDHWLHQDRRQGTRSVQCHGQRDLAQRGDTDDRVDHSRQEGGADRRDPQQALRRPQRDVRRGGLPRFRGGGIHHRYRAPGRRWAVDVNGTIK